jgi:uncharacterized protein (UPF0548 family)
MLTFRRPSGQAFRDANARLASLEPNGHLPGKIRTTSETIGWGHKRFEKAKVALRHLEQFDLPGTFISGADRARVGARYWVHANRLGLWTSAPVQVEHFEEQKRRVALGILTLESHPLAGMEEFLLEMHDNGVVTLTISAQAEPVLAWSRLIRPWIRVMQARFRRAAIRRVRNASARVIPQAVI